MGVADTIARNLDERVSVLLGLRGAKKDHAVRHGELEKLVNEIVTRYDERRSTKDSTFGENPNGSYLRFENGAQICWSYLRKSLAIDVAFQGQYRSAEQLWTFPVPFIPNKTLDVVAQPAGASASGSYVVGTVNTSCRFALTNATTQTAATRIAHLWAIGRWR